MDGSVVFFGNATLNVYDRVRIEVKRDLDANRDILDLPVLHRRDCNVVMGSASVPVLNNRRAR